MNPNGYFLSFTVGTDGTGLRAIPAPIAGPDAVVLPTFQVAGRRVGVVNVSTDTDSPNCTVPVIFPAREVYVQDGQNLLQLTRFGMCDTTGFFVSRNRRILFCASRANPTKENPLFQSQLFSIDALGGHLRQLTHFAGAFGYCHWASTPVLGRCHIPAAVEDEETGGIVFESSCDPLGTNPNGDLLFAMRSDGSGLRQLTHTRGFVEGADESDGAVEVELSGPFAYAARGK
jgi:hypothetical protein